MKKLLLSLLLLTPSLSYADTVTQGYVGLLQVSTGVVDPTRNWGDKYNANFGIIASSMTSLSNRNSVIVGYDEGTRQGDITTLNVTGTGVDLSVSGTTGTLNVTASGGGGASSLAIATGSAQASNIISSPTSIVNFSSGPFKVRFISPSTAYIDIDYSSITAQGRVSASGGGSDNLGSHFSTTTLQAGFGINASSGVFTSSLTAFGVVSSTSGFVGGGSTFTRIAVGPSGPSNPAITFGNDGNTGIYSQADDQILIAVGGSANSTFNSDGLNVYPGRIFTLGAQENSPAYSFTTETNSGLFLNIANDVGIGKGGTERLVARTAGYNESVSSFTSKLVVTSSNGYIGGSSTVTALNVSERLVVNQGDTVSPSLEFGSLGSGTGIGFLSGGTGIRIWGGGTSLATFDNATSRTIFNTALTFSSAGGGGSAPIFRLSTLHPTYGLYSDYTITTLNHWGFANNGSEVMRFDNFSGGSVAFGRKRASASVTISTISSNVPVLNVTSDTVKFEITGASTTVMNDFYLGRASVATFMSTSSSLSNDLQNRVSTQTLVYNGGINITAIDFGGSASGSQNGSTLTITATGGAGSSGGGVSLQSGASVVSVSTFLFPGATITSDGQGASSVTFTPQILSTWTAFTNYTSTAQAVGISTQNIQSAFAVHASSLDFRLNSQFSAAFSSISALGVSTQTYSTFDNARASSAAVQIDSMSAVIGGIAVSTRANSSEWSVRITTTIGRDVFNVMNTTNSSLNDLQNSSATAFYNTINSTAMAVRTATAALVNEISTRTLTYSGGVNITAIAFSGSASGSQSGSTLTISATGGPGGGGGSSVEVLDGGVQITSNSVATIHLSSGSLDAYAVGASTVVINLSTSARTVTHGVTFDGGGGTLANGPTYYLSIPYNATIASYTIIGNSAGSIRVNIKKSNYDNFPPVTSICAGACPSFSGTNNRNRDFTLNGWDREVNSGDVYSFNIDTAPASVSWANLQLYLLKK